MCCHCADTPIGARPLCPYGTRSPWRRSHRIVIGAPRASGGSIPRAHRTVSRPNANVPYAPRRVRADALGGGSPWLRPSSRNDSSSSHSTGTTGSSSRCASRRSSSDRSASRWRRSARGGRSCSGASRPRSGCSRTSSIRRPPRCSRTNLAGSRSTRTRAGGRDSASSDRSPPSATGSAGRSSSRSSATSWGRSSSPSGSRSRATVTGDAYLQPGVRRLRARAAARDLRDPGGLVVNVLGVKPSLAVGYVTGAC